MFYDILEKNATSASFLNHIVDSEPQYSRLEKVVPLGTLRLSPVFKN